MKKLIILFVFLMGAFSFSHAQKFAIVDMEYIMKHVPAYESANEQLNQVSKKWQAEVEAKMQVVQNLYKTYQTEVVFMSPEMKTKRENEIVEKEKAAQDLKRQYFGPEGELYKKRQSLMKPIQDEVYNAIQTISNDKGYQLILDKSSSMNIIFSSPKIDISDEVLVKLGYSK
ncbi:MULTISPECIES: OmpH family outer membrane protein [Paludibacter]|uniref:Outer membrane protein n=1 Tax=Paludibacter jiangxiensis TaxID=681398 RepID=A0A161L7P1_9BACT|nr:MULTISPECIES: OmpH family outer membrane protein [Paludibacter]MTK53210.1 OmpH family outer membrane protein [Paludibacter sp.]GAT62794.1 outer membrane protein [Paludibacter jiangxiensis]